MMNKLIPIAIGAAVAFYLLRNRLRIVSQSVDEAGNELTVTFSNGTAIVVDLKEGYVKDTTLPYFGAIGEIEKKGKMVLITNLEKEKWIRPFFMQDFQNVNVLIEKNVSLKISADVKVWNHELKQNHWIHIEREFKIGDIVEYDSYNLVYTGPITAIGEKTVTIESTARGNVRHKLDEFLYTNWDFSLEKVRKRNSEWMD